MFKSTDGHFPPGDAAYSDCFCVDELPDSVIDDIVAAARQLPTPHAAILFHDLRGAATRVAVDATAYPVRKPHILLQLITREHSRTVSDKARVWVHELSAKIKPHAMKQTWGPLVGRTDEDRQRMTETFRDNIPRLTAVKKRVDAHNVFAPSWVPLPI